ncbi:MAG: SDR family oxidoreductase [Devosia sp.]|nr:SDR family oxidoreductase [Devosia sp.]
MALLGDGASAEQVDVAGPPDLDACHAAVEGEVGPISILVHLASIAGNNAPLTQYDVAVWHKVIAVNLTGCFYVERRFWADPVHSDEANGSGATALYPVPGP